MEILQEITKAVYDGEEQTTVELVKKALAEGLRAQDIVDQGLVKGLHECGAGYEAGEKFIPEMLMAAEAMKASMAILKPHLVAGESVAGAKVVLATVEGDVHDIGLELVATMLGSAGFEVNFMGPDVETSRIINAVKEDKPQLLGLSALLTNTMDVMPVILKQLEKEGLRNSLKVIIGGAPVSQDFANLIGADGFAYDAAAAVPVAKKLVS
ncbi:MAG: cobalamin-dependent protein [Deltaproteobacteria bacterium]|nr:cobalamin-dependent protein [Deltaproteobacteria bacterium]